MTIYITLGIVNIMIPIIMYEYGPFPFGNHDKGGIMLIGVFSPNTKLSYYLGETVKEYGEIKYIDTEVTLYDSIWEFLSDPKSIDLAFVDERFSDYSPIEIARIIKSKNKKTAIVLLAEGKDNLLESVNLNLHSYLLKPISQQMIFETLDDYLRKHAENRVILAKLDRTAVNFFTSEIYYIEADGKGSIISTKKGEYNSKSNFGELQLQLNGDSFFTIHRSYCVNMGLIKNFDDEIVTMRNQHILPISRRRKIDFLIAFGKYARRTGYIN